jgi:hypothetical protein
VDAIAPVSPDVRDRLVAFLGPVCAAIADLAATCTDATDDDLIAVLGPHVLSLPGPQRARTEAALAGVVVDRLRDGARRSARRSRGRGASACVADGREPRAGGEGPFGGTSRSERFKVHVLLDGAESLRFDP